MLKLCFRQGRAAQAEFPHQFQVAEINHVFANPNWLFNFHSHECLAEIILIAGGRGTYSINGTAFPAAQGDLFLINPHALHAVMSDPSDPLDSWTLTFTGARFPTLPENYILPPSGYPFCGQFQDYRLMKSLFERIVAEYADSGSEQDLLASDLVLQLGFSILLLSRQAFSQNTDVSVLPPKQTQRHLLALEIMGYINAHYCEAISNDMLAKQFHVSVGHLGHVFSEEFGISPINYQISRRMSDAQWMLIQTDKSIHKISCELGYENPYHFTKLFIKRIGIHPQDFRKQFQPSHPTESS